MAASSLLCSYYLPQFKQTKHRNLNKRDSKTEELKHRAF